MQGVHSISISTFSARTKRTLHLDVRFTCRACIVSPPSLHMHGVHCISTFATHAGRVLNLHLRYTCRARTASPPSLHMQGAHCISTFATIAGRAINLHLRYTCRTCSISPPFLQIKMEIETDLWNVFNTFCYASAEVIAKIRGILNFVFTTNLNIYANIFCMIVILFTMNISV